jgi:hypothetical protein
MRSKIIHLTNLICLINYIIRLARGSGRSFCEIEPLLKPAHKSGRGDPEIKRIKGVTTLSTPVILGVEPCRLQLQ